MRSGSGLPTWKPEQQSNDSGWNQKHDGRVDFQCGAANRVLIFVYLRRRTGEDCFPERIRRRFRKAASIWFCSMMSCMTFLNLMPS